MHIRNYASFTLALGFYAFTRLYALEEFPIYFFTDEAVHPVYGVELVQNDFRNAARDWLPTYFQNGQYWNLSLSVYLHALTATLFGKSIFVTRATSALVSSVGVAAVALMLKWIFQIRLWWLAVLLLALAPAWFLHSRTAFETVLMVSFYAGFLLCYLLYRYRAPRFIFPALAFGAATFYSYSNGQAVMLVSGILLLFSDWRYHLKHWRLGFCACAFGVLLFIPYLRFRLQYPDAVTSQLYLLNSYWLQPLPVADKLARFVRTFGYGLSPQYWFAPDAPELARHVVKGYGNLAWWTLPLVLGGVAIGLRNLRSSAHRALLIAALAAPFGSALAEIGITRVLMFVIPASIFATLGLDAALARIKTPRRHRAAGACTTALLVLASLAMLRDALVNGPTWYRDYGLYGMQWGVKQIFVETVPMLARDYTHAAIHISHTWANGTDIFARFFPLDRARVRVESVQAFLDRQLPLGDDALFVMTREEFVAAQSSPKLKPIEILQTIHYPDSALGFVVARIAYADNAAEIFAAERAAQRQPVTEAFELHGETVQVMHTKFDMGSLRHIFDGDIYSAARGVEMNPLTLEIAFAQPRPLSELTGIFGRVRFQLRAQLFGAETAEPTEYVGTFDSAASVPGQFSGPPATLAFERGPARVSRIRLEVLYLEGGENAHVHIFDMSVK